MEERRNTVLHVTTDPWIAERMVRRLQRIHPSWDVQAHTSYAMPEATKLIGGGRWRPSAATEQDMTSASVYFPAECVRQLPHAPMLMRGRHVSNQPLLDSAQRGYQRAGLRTGVHHMFMTAMFGSLPPPVSVYCSVVDTASSLPVHLMFTNFTDMDGAANQRDVKMYILRTIRNIVMCALDAECSRVVIHTRMADVVVRLLTAYIRKSKRGAEHLHVDVHVAPSFADSPDVPRVRGFVRSKRALECTTDGVLNVYDQPPDLFVGSPSVTYEPAVPVSVFDICNPNVNLHLAYRIV